jgi:hypothetical protein
VVRVQSSYRFFRVAGPDFETLAVTDFGDFFYGNGGIGACSIWRLEDVFNGGFCSGFDGVVAVLVGCVITCFNKDLSGLKEHPLCDLGVQKWAGGGCRFCRVQ